MAVILFVALISLAALWDFLVGIRAIPSYSIFLLGSVSAGALS